MDKRIRQVEDKIKPKNKLDELYISSGFRSFAAAMVAVFVYFYLYELGFSIQDILIYELVFTLGRIPINYLTARVISHIGPKHTIAISIMLSIVFMSVLFSLDSIAWPLVFVAFLDTLAASFYWTSYRVYYSKVTTHRHAGSQAGNMRVIQSAAELSAPVIGGVIAWLVSPQATIAAATCVYFMSLVPLFISSEPIPVRKRPNYKSLWTKMNRDFGGLLAQAGARTIDSQVYVLWILFIAITIFTENAYGFIGVLTSVSLLLAMLTSRIVGRLTDRGRSVQLLHLGVLLQIMLSVAKLVIRTPLAAATHNVVNEQAIKTLQIPLDKGINDESDSFNDQRVEYIVTVENFIMLVRALWLVIPFVLIQFMSPLDTLRAAAAVGGLAVLLVLLQNYPSLKPKAIE